MADGEWGEDPPDIPDLLLALDKLRKGLPPLERRNPVMAAMIRAYLREISQDRQALEYEIDSLEPRHVETSKPAKATGKSAAKEEPRPCIYTLKGMVRPVFEFLVLRWLFVMDDSICDKRDIYDELSGRLAFDLGKFTAFSTRMADLKKTEFVDWETNGQGAQVQLTEKGREQLQKFMAGELKPSYRKYLADTVDWSGLRGGEGQSSPSSKT